MKLCEPTAMYRGRRLLRSGPVILLVASLLMFSGCRLTYLFQVAAGEYRLLNGAVPLGEAMKNGSLDQNQRAHLALVQGIKDFGETELGLKKTSIYKTVNLDPHQPTVYVVSACPKDRLDPVTWWFPVVGKMPYLGFFDLESAQAEKQKLLGKGLDVYIGMAEAYSTLGWFKDPLTLNLIGTSTLDFVETILHEMTHATLYVKGQGEFNEGLAMMVGKEGALLFMERTFGPSHPLSQEAEKSIHDEHLFSSFLCSLLDELNHLYRSPLSYQEKLAEREKVFASSLERFKLLKSQFQTQRFAPFEHAPMNNAFLVSVAVYHRPFLLFEQALHRHGDSIKDMLQWLKLMAQEDGNMLAMMKERLEKPEVHCSSGSEFPWEPAFPPIDVRVFLHPHQKRS
jgi:predicted aminopeptidase